MCAGGRRSDNNYTCPPVDFSDRIEIHDGRHPVVEKMLTDRLFIPNDTILDGNDNRVAHHYRPEHGR